LQLASADGRQAAAKSAAKIGKKSLFVAAMFGQQVCATGDKFQVEGRLPQRCQMLPIFSSPKSNFG
jgi:hypothetical protein